MIDEQVDMWTRTDGIRCITTNGIVVGPHMHPRNVMGAGTALQAATRYKMLPYLLGKRLQKYGNIVFYFPSIDLITFPTMQRPGEVDLDLIKLSVKDLLRLSEMCDLEKVYLPRPGCGVGGADYETQIRPLLGPLDDRFVVCYV